MTGVSNIHTIYYIKETTLNFHSIFRKLAEHHKTTDTKLVLKLVDMVLQKHAGELIKLEHDKTIELSDSAKELLNKIADNYIRENL